MASLLIRLSTERERKASNGTRVGMKTRIVLISIFLLIATSGCGIGTLFSYSSYSRCLEECDKQKFQDDSSKQQCKAKCLSQFNWSDSPLRGVSQAPDRPKSELDKIMEPPRLPK